MSGHVQASYFTPCKVHVCVLRSKFNLNLGSRVQNAELQVLGFGLCIAVPFRFSKTKDDISDPETIYVLQWSW
jgi:hypothetical protein